MPALLKLLPPRFSPCLRVSVVDLLPPSCPGSQSPVLHTADLLIARSGTAAATPQCASHRVCSGAESPVRPDGPPSSRPNRLPSPLRSRDRKDLLRSTASRS